MPLHGIWLINYPIKDGYILRSFTTARHKSNTTIQLILFRKGISNMQVFKRFSGANKYGILIETNSIVPGKRNCHLVEMASFSP